MWSDPAPGLAIHHDGHRTRLKWHRLRRSLLDPLFSAASMAEGFRLGASMELDLRVRADGGFVVLHDSMLGREIDGVGPVQSKTRSELAALRFRDSARTPMMSEDLAALISAAHPDALLQFDMKDDLAAIGETGIAHLAKCFGDVSGPVIISGDCLDLITVVRNSLPKLRRGIDPTDPLAALLADRPAAAAAGLTADLRGPTAPGTVYLEWRLLLRAAAAGLDLIALAHAEGCLVDAWTYTPAGIADGLTAAEADRFASLLALKPDQITTDEAVALDLAWRAVSG